jgi:alpha-N-arabinofuranosidase
MGRELLMWVVVGVALSIVLPAAGRTIVVAQIDAARDTNAGTEAQPLRTIQAAADLAQPGDTVLVHAGTYRERIVPPRGGTDEDHRITYRAAPGETVAIKGSQRITTWRKDSATGVWLAELDPEFFGNYNPYALTVSGPFMTYGQQFHRGQVYLDELPLCEKLSLEEVRAAPMTWVCAVDEKSTRIWANFGDADPNRQLAEINVRHSVFFPHQAGLAFITIDGFVIAQSAENWAPPGNYNDTTQYGAIGPCWGYRWIIENCTITDAKCVGIILGSVAGSKREGGAPFGHHLIRNNHILRCGQSGIAGDSGNFASLVEDNLVEQTNFQALFGGYETAGIKLHFAVDTVIRHNVVRGVRANGNSGFGLWLDYGNQNTRVTGNVFTETEGANLFIEASHGPVLVDNNVFLGGDINLDSEALIFAHNLFYKSVVHWTGETRQPQTWEPHSFKQTGVATISPRDDRWIGNIFLGGGLAEAPPAGGFVIDHNVFLDGAKPSRFDLHSVTDDPPAVVQVKASADQITIQWHMSPQAAELNVPVIDSAMLGRLGLPNVRMENPDGSALTIDHDYFDRLRPKGPGPAGPFGDVKAGINSYVLWSAMPGEKS